MDVEQLKKVVQSGRISVDRLIELIVTLQRELHTAERRIERLERQQGIPPSPKISQPLSVEAEERRQEARGKKRRKRKWRSHTARTTSAEKISATDRLPHEAPASHRTSPG